MLEKVKRFYNMGLYRKEQVLQFVEKGVMTEEAYQTVVEETGDGSEVKG